MNSAAKDTGNYTQGWNTLREVSHHTMHGTVSSLSKRLKHTSHILELTSCRKKYVHLYIYIHIPGHSAEEISAY